MLTRLPIKHSPAGADPSGGGLPSAGEPGASGLLDPLALQRLRELDPQGTGQLIERVIQAFNGSTARMLPQMRAAGQAGDLNGVRLVAHTLKSSSASLGATLLSQLCSELENQLRTGSAADLDSQIESIAAEIAVVLQVLNVFVNSAE